MAPSASSNAQISTQTEDEDKQLAPATSTSISSTFLSLPFETRAHILEYAYEPSNACVLQCKTQTWSNRSWAIPLSIIIKNSTFRRALPISRQYYSEAKALAPAHGLVFCSLYEFDKFVWFRETELRSMNFDHIRICLWRELLIWEQVERAQRLIKILHTVTRDFEIPCSNTGTPWTQRLEEDWLVIRLKSKGA